MTGIKKGRYPVRLFNLYVLAYSLILLSLLFTGCKDKSSGRRYQPAGHTTDHRKPLSWGQDHVIYVFADDNVWRYAEQPLRESLERYYWTTENETYFELKRAKFQDLSTFYRFRNLLFLGHLDSNNEVSAYVKERLSEKVISSVKENGVGLFSRHNLWANNQFVVFLLGTTERNLLKYNILQANQLFEMFKDKLYSYTANRIYAVNIHPETLFEPYLWSLKLPVNYIIYKRDDDNNFISFLARRKDNPDRYVSVYSEKHSGDSVNTEWAIATRSKIAWDYYDEDEFVREDIRFENVDFASRKAVRMSGRWQNRKYAIGGAFQCFAFYDEKTGKAWLIDNSVFYPEGYKLPALIETEVISRTFELKTGGEL